MNALMNITIRMQAAQATREIDYLRARIKQLEAEMGRAGMASAGMFSGGMRGLARWGSQMQWAGRQLQTNFTLPVVAAGVVFTKWVLDNERAMTRIEKVYGDASNSTQLWNRDVQGLTKAFEALSVRYAVQQSEVREIAADWAAAGASGAALAQGVDSTLQAMILGEFEAAEATEALISIQAQWGADSKELTRILGVLNATENATGITFKGLVEGMQRSASVARDAGIDVEHLAAMLAALTPASGTAANAGNALKTMVSRLVSPTGEAVDILALMGHHTSDLEWKSLNAAERIELLARSYNNLDKETGYAEETSEKFISSQAGIVSSTIASRYQINRFSTLMRDVYASIDDNAETNGYYGKTLKLLEDPSAVAASAVRELNKVLQSEPMVAKRAGIVLQNSFMKVVTMLLPHILTLMNMVAKAAEAFSNLDPGIQKAIVAVLAFLAVLGPPLIILGSLAVAIGRIGMLVLFLAGPLAMIRGAFKKNEAGVRGYQVALSGMAGKVRKAFAGIIPAIGAATSTAVPAAAAAGSSVGNAFTGAMAMTNQARGAAIVGQANTTVAGVSGAWSRLRPQLKAHMTTAQLVVGSGFTAMSYQATRGMIALNGAVTAGMVGVHSGITTGMATSNAAVTTGMQRTTFTVQRAMAALPVHFTAGWKKINLGVYAMQASLNRATQRNLMTNLTILNGYVNAATAVGARGAAQMSAAMHVAAGAAIQRGGAARAAGLGGAAAAGSMVGGMMASLKKLGPRLLTFFKNLGPQIIKGLQAILPLLRTWGLRLLGFITGPIGLAITAALGLLYMFRDQIAQIFHNIGEMAQDATNPFGAAWAGVVNLFNKGVEAAQRGFQLLPEGVQNALRAVVGLVEQAAKKVYEFFSYMNPFAKHSPSLVENVTNGMAVVGERFGLAANVIRGHMQSSYASLQRFGAATAGFMDKVAKLGRAEERASVAKHAGSGAAAAYDALQAQLPALQRDLANVNTALEKQETTVARLKGVVDAHKRTVDALQDSYDQLADKAGKVEEQLNAAQDRLREFSEAPITGMRKMSDALFENEMAQKRLRLELAKLGADGSAEQRMASLRGEIESLQGMTADLRAAGAGSEITRTYNDQITALEAQHRAIAQGQGPIEQMQKQMEELQKASEILDLENSIQFDPLIRQVEQLSNSYKEMPFAQIIAGVTTQKAEVDRLEAAHSTATAAVDRQRAALDAAKDSMDAASSAYDAQNAILDGLQSVYESTEKQIRSIETALSDVVGASEEMQAALDEAKRKAEETGRSEILSPAAQNFMDAAGGSYLDPGNFNVIGDEMKDVDIDSWLDNYLKDTGTIFDKVDPFKGIRDRWGRFTGWWDTNVVPIFTNLGEGIRQIFADVDWVAPFRSIGEWFSGDTNSVGGAIGAWWARVSEPLGKAWENIKTAWDEAMVTLRPTLTSLGDTFSNLWVKLQEAWTMMQPVFGVLGKALGILAGIVGAVVAGGFIILANIIEHVVMPVIRTIIGVIDGVIQVLTGLVDFVVGVFTGDWERAWNGILKIFGGTFDAIYAVVEGAIGVVIGFIRGLVEGVVSWFDWLYDILVGHSIIPDMVKAIVGWFKNMWNWVVERVIGMKDAVVNGFQNLKDRGVQLFEDVRNAVVTKAGNLRDKVAEALGILRDRFMGAFGHIRDNIERIMTGITGFIKGGINNAIRAVNKLITGLNKVADILPGLDWTISTIPLLARGGTVPAREVNGGFVARNARAIVGEGRTAYPEFVVPTDPRHRKRATELYNRLGGKLGVATDDPALGIGGPVDTIKNWIGNGAKLASQATDWIQNAAQGAVSTVIRPLFDMARSMANGVQWEAGSRWANAGLDSVWSWVTDADESFRQASRETGGNGPWRKPLNNYSLSSGFGMRTHPITGVKRLHAGLDLAAPTGTNVMAAAAGMLTRAVMSGGLGNYMTIDHGQGLRTVYGHLSAFVKGNGMVNPGDIIGKVGSTGASTGPHLHFEIRPGGPVDPRAFMSGKGIQMATGGIVRSRRGGTLATVGEGGRDEAVIPLPSNWQSLFAQLKGINDTRNMNAQVAKHVQRMGDLASAINQRTTHVTENKTYNFYGNLEFPNISSPEDADDFLKQLDDLAGR